MLPQELAKIEKFSSIGNTFMCLRGALQMCRAQPFSCLFQIPERVCVMWKVKHCNCTAESSVLLHENPF